MEAGFIHCTQQNSVHGIQLIKVMYSEFASRGGIDNFDINRNRGINENDAYISDLINRSYAFDVSEEGEELALGQSLPEVVSRMKRLNSR